MSNHPDTKALAQNRWLEVLPKLGIDVSLLDGRHHPSPVNGGVDGFRFIDKQGDGYYVNNNEFGDGFALLKLLYEWNFKEASKQVDLAMGWADGYIPLTTAEKEAFKEKQAEVIMQRKAALNKQHAEAAKKAVVIWESAND